MTMNAIMRAVSLALVLVPLAGCSVASLAWNDALDRRLTTLEGEVRTLEASQSAPKPNLAALVVPR